MTDKDILNAINKIIIYYGNLIKFRKSEDLDTAAYGVIAAISALVGLSSIENTSLTNESKPATPGVTVDKEYETD